MNNYPELRDCRICPRNCGINRERTFGYCRSGILPKISSWDLHHGEEAVLSGIRGSGTIFFTNCNLKCVFCQNYEISQLGWGNEITKAELVRIMLSLQDKQAHNINLVTPTHFTPQIREALREAKKRGLKLPIIWNTNAYEKPEILATLKDLVDIYLPDFKYSSKESAQLYSDALDYPEVTELALKEMYNQVGHLIVNKEGIAERGILIRILILPKDLINLEGILNWIAANLGTETRINLMAQYHPVYKANSYPEISRRITLLEYEKAKKLALEIGFKNVYLK